jgi:GTP diphosphokinase / guanosine-3',5'-bis(diphosphate) 3'-diphosphatase
MPKPSDNHARVHQGVGFTAAKHRDQRRKDVTAAPYINHPIAVANVLANEARITDPVVLSAALLHELSRQGQEMPA